jgi:MOSC domain-containing protein YiiM
VTVGAVHQINLSPGGVPKLPIAGDVEVTTLGMVGDGHNDSRNHGGPDRALCLFSLEVIEGLQAEGHPISPGSAGENLTISGITWDELRSGDRLQIGDDVTAELITPTSPCAKNTAWFVQGDYRRMDDRLHPGSSRWNARVITEGVVRPGDSVRLMTSKAGRR